MSNPGPAVPLAAAPPQRRQGACRWGTPTEGRPGRRTQDAPATFGGCGRGGIGGVGVEGVAATIVAAHPTDRIGPAARITGA